MEGHPRLSPAVTILTSSCPNRILSPLGPWSVTHSLVASCVLGQAHPCVFRIPNKNTGLSGYGLSLGISPSGVRRSIFPLGLEASWLDSGLEASPVPIYNMLSGPNKIRPPL